MRVYLAAAFSRQAEIKEVAARLENLGVMVTSRWLYAESMFHKPTLSRVEDAFADIRDLREADILIRFADITDSSTVPSRLISGARMFECGLAWERGMPIFVVQGKQNVFDYFPNIVHFATVDDLLQYFTESKPSAEKPV